MMRHQWMGDAAPMKAGPTWWIDEPMLLAGGNPADEKPVELRKKELIEFVKILGRRAGDDDWVTEERKELLRRWEKL
jgi:hypothetical protein